jgi:hypothetical protein
LITNALTQPSAIATQNHLPPERIAKRLKGAANAPQSTQAQANASV